VELGVDERKDGGLEDDTPALRLKDNLGHRVGLRLRSVVVRLSHAVVLVLESLESFLVIVICALREGAILSNHRSQYRIPFVLVVMSVFVVITALLIRIGERCSKWLGSLGCDDGEQGGLRGDAVVEGR